MSAPIDARRIEAGALELYDAGDPIGGLRTRGFSCTRVVSSRSAIVERSGYPVAASTRHFVRHRWGLPTAPAVRGELVRETLKHALLKVFAKEIQVGDAAFDDAVYVSTDTPDAMAALLGARRFRDAVYAIVRDGGSVEIDDDGVTVEIVDESSVDAEPDPVTEATIVAFVAATAA